MHDKLKEIQKMLHFVYFELLKGRIEGAKCDLIIIDAEIEQLIEHTKPEGV